MAKSSKQNSLKKRKSPVQKMDGNSYNPQQELLELLRTKCPEVFTEGKIDPKKLKRTLGEEVAADGERYGLSGGSLSPAILVLRSFSEGGYDLVRLAAGRRPVLQK